jgi:uncharacterized membrane protein
MPMKKVLWKDSWAEMVTLFIMIITFIFSLFIDAAVVAYILVFFAGVFVGKDWRKRRHRIRFPFYMMVAGFLLSVLVANWIRNRGNPLIIIMFFIIGTILGRYLFEKDVLRV